jgi:hypothetical protein
MNLPLIAGRDRMLRSNSRLDSGGQRAASWLATRRPSQRWFMAAGQFKKEQAAPQELGRAALRRGHWKTSADASQRVPTKP